MTFLEVVLCQYIAGVLACFVYLWRQHRLVVALPGYEQEALTPAIATAGVRLAISTYWPVFLYIESCVERRRIK